MSPSPNVTHNISTLYPSIQSILNSLTQLISSHNISPLIKQFHSSLFLPIATHYSMNLCTEIRSCRRGFTMIQFCLFYNKLVQPSLINIQYWFFSVNIQIFLISQSYWYGNKIKTSKVPLLTRGKVITYVSTSLFMYVCRSQNLLSKLEETLLRGKEQLYLRGRRGYCALEHQSTGWEVLPELTKSRFSHLQYIQSIYREFILLNSERQWLVQYDPPWQSSLVKYL